MRKSSRLAAVCLNLIIFVSLLPQGLAQSKQTGNVAGRVFDERTNAALPGAVISVDGSVISADSDRSGAYLIQRVPVGKRTVTISYLGYEAAAYEVEVTASETVTLNVPLKPGAGLKEEITVQAEPILEGQARALNQQRNAINIQNIVAADQIGRFPDPNAAEAAQRIPGITLQRDQGEGRYILVRGTEARLNSMMINGERIPSPEGDIRNVALDVIPADLLEAIEVSKALTPDMDADSIGGSVNLVTKSAPERMRVSATFGLGYNDIVNDGLQTFNGTFGRRFKDNKLGLTLSGSFLNTDRGSDNFEAEYDDGFLDTLELRDYRINRKRWGINGATDYRFSNNSELYFRGIFNQFDDQEFRRTVAFGVADGEIERHLKDRFEGQQIISVSSGGRHLLNNLVRFDYRFSFSYAEEEEPNRVDSSFVQEDVEFNPNVSPDFINPDNIQPNPLNQDFSQFLLNDIVREDNFTSEKDFTVSFNLAMPFSSSTAGGLFKFGGKFRNKNKDRDNNAIAFEADDIFLTDLSDRNFRQRGLIDGRYNSGNAFVDPAGARTFITRPDVESETDFESDAADYDVKERVFAGYAMAELYLGERFTLLPGLRYERTKNDHNAFRVLFNEDGDFQSLTPVSGESSYGDLLPGLHARYRLGDNTVLRAAFTRSLARPNYVDLSPFELILEEDREIERGNPNLEATTSWNFDLMGERYFSTVGVLSAGLFYKSLRDNIFIFRSEELRNGDDFEVFQPLNGRSGSLFGVELAFQNQLRFLPSPLDGLGLYFNYTYADSNAELPIDLDEGVSFREATLPGQAKHVGNLSVSYEKYGFSGRVSMNYHGKYINEVADRAEQDIFIDKHFQLDLSASQRLTRHLRVFVELNNLTDEPFRRFEGFKNRPVQEEYYSWWGTFGIKIDF